MAEYQSAVIPNEWAPKTPSPKCSFNGFVSHSTSIVLVETVQLSGVDSLSRLAGVLRRVADHRTNRFDELLPVAVYWHSLNEPASGCSQKKQQ